MQNETGNNIGGSNDTGTLEAEVRSAVEQGHDVQEMVRQLTLRRISARSLHIESLRQIARAVLSGARAGTQKELQQSAAQTEITRARLKQAVAGLDTALAQFAEASKLALEEAAGRAQTFSSDDLARARSDLESLEAMFLETLQSAASATKDVAGEILHDLAAHARAHGSAVGAQLKETLVVMTHQFGATGRAQVGAGLHLAQATPTCCVKSRPACAPAWPITSGLANPKARATDAVASGDAARDLGRLLRDCLDPDPLRLRRHGAPHGPGRRAGTRRPGAALARRRRSCAPGAAGTRTPRAGGDGPDLRQAGPDACHPRRPVRSGMDRRIRQAAGQRARRALREIRRATGEDLAAPPEDVFAALRSRAAGGGIHRPGAPRPAARRQRGRRQGAPPRHPAVDRSRPALAGAAGGARRGGEPGIARLPPARAGAPVRPVAAPRAGLRRRVPQRRAHRGQLRGLSRRRCPPPRPAGRRGAEPPADAPPGHRHPAHLLAVDRRAGVRAGVRRGHPRPRPGGRRRRPAWTARCSPGAARMPC